jgi:hypothetical protein
MILLLACTSGDPDDTADTNDTPEGHDSGEPIPDADQRDENARSGPGDFAADFVASGTYTKLTVEVDWVIGEKPAQDALDHLVSVLGAVCDKPDGVTVVLDDEIPAQGGPAWTLAAAGDLADAWRDRYRDPDAGEAVLHFLYVDGHSADDNDSGRILGYAYRGSSLVMFHETIADAGSGLLGLGADVEPTVLVHEAGHELGLVDNGAPMQTPHRDEAHGHHDSDDGCVMYWAAETDAIGDLLGGEPLGFDDRCLADLAALRGG